MKKIKYVKNIGKKGFTYLLIASILIAIVLIVFLTTQRYKYQDRQEIDQIRIKTINDFVKGFNDDVERATYISSFRTLLAIEDYIATKGTFLNNTETQFQETFYYGTLNGSIPEIMEDSSFQNYLTNMNNIANKMGIQTQVNISKISLKHSNPWNIEVSINSNISIQDKEGLVSWEYQKEFKTILPIENLRDPLYSTFTNNRVPNTIIQNPFENLVNSTNNNTTNLKKLINNSYYVESSNAPNFLMRFENNYSPDPLGYGIESIVNIGEINAQDIEVYSDRVKIDYIYFNNLDSTKICDVDGIPSEYYFVIPQNKTNLYEINELNYSTSCP
ncbi:hypothetical protein K9M18_00705 [Candidatus Woesearchaeota archaeon]|nr:hypothetical protein [Candidatus Woesearchaeota archaeon]MCF8013444.1 hypothetical protein [Candidatus Woesearchaeota archaeon]